MKLLRVEFENFRLLRNLALDFSTSDTKNLTVIRAENESGKTTILTALQWALYGDEALPNKGRDFRLHPVDWDASTDNSVSISVQIDFETTQLRHRLDGTNVENKRQYRIVRSTNETLNGADWNRSSSTVKLFHLTNTGSQLIEPPQAVINEELAPELRDVFFTDGDRALNFIEATSTTVKRDGVKKAIRSLLGLEVIEKAKAHVNRAEARVNKRVQQFSTDSELIEITTRLEEIVNNISKFEEKVSDASEQLSAFDAKLTEVQKEIDNALILGDREKLQNEHQQTREQLKNVDNQNRVAAKEHSELFKSLELSYDLLEPILMKGFNKLSELHKAGKIPNSTIPVLEEQLKNMICICGESLDSANTNGKHRRKHIRKLIEKTKEADEIQSAITDLYFGLRNLRPDQSERESQWIANYGKIAERRGKLEDFRNNVGKKVKAIEAEISAIPSTDIQGLRTAKQNYVSQRDRFNRDHARYETQLETLRKDRELLNSKRDNLLRVKDKDARVLAELEVIRDIQQVLGSSYDRISNEELNKVSDQMNDLFLDMIGSDPEQGTIIQRAEITSDFDIVVYGPRNRLLNPDIDLNGASRRALTLAFILALTVVSGVKAPNVIDTPLGMMSGFVKRSVLKTTVNKSSQLILFLTRSEITDCEEILDSAADRVITLTNPTHYPRILVNAPPIDQVSILKCKCNHRQECSLCQRKRDANSSFDEQRAVR